MGGYRRDKRATVSEHWLMTDEPLPLDQGLFGQLRRDASKVWKDFVAPRRRQAVS